jgi:peptide-methionine (S)-S-oxide reductase
VTTLLSLLLAVNGALSANEEQVAVFAGGCFWGVEAVFEHVKGVTRVTSGYAGGTKARPSYEEVSAGETGHAESVEILYDPSRISYEQLLEIFFAVAHDPTQLNRQGPDAGTQYRSVIFYGNETQKREAESFVARLTRERRHSAPIVTEIVPLRAFYPAEAYHQDFAAKHPLHPYILIHDRPKIARLKQSYPALYR